MRRGAGTDIASDSDEKATQQEFVRSGEQVVCAESAVKEVAENAGLDGIPARAGVGFDLAFYQDIIDHRPAVRWFEILAEDYMEAGGLPHHKLRKIREHYPLSVYGVGMSIGSHGPLDKAHLLRLKTLCDRYQPGLVSEHLGWSGLGGMYLNELLPLPYNDRTLEHVCAHIDEIQTCLGRSILVENPSTFGTFLSSDKSEVEFLSAVVQITGCGLLLDVNNVYVSAVNSGLSADGYIDSFPMTHVEEIHLGARPLGRNEVPDSFEVSHARDVAEIVWQIYRRALSRAGAKPTLIEWSNDVPAWSVVAEEAHQVDLLLELTEKNDDRSA